MKTKIKKYENEYRRWLKSLFKTFGLVTLEQIQVALDTNKQLDEGFYDYLVTKINWSPINYIYDNVAEKNLEYIQSLFSKLNKKEKVIATNNIINNSVNNLLPQISMNQINTTKKQNFFELQKSLIETDLNKTFESRKNQLDQFRDSFLFNTKDKFNVFKEKYPEPTYKFTDSMGRTQVNNLNRDLSSSLATSVGFKKFEWITSNDERVRESHRKLNGKIFDYDNLPSEYNDYNCRCDLLPVLESIED